jgi:hypothetical protein
VNDMTEMTTQNPLQTPEQLAELAAQLVQVVRSVRLRVPGFTLPHATRPVLTGLATTIPVQAVEVAMNICAAQPGLAEAIGAAEVLADHRFTGAFSELRDEAKLLDSALDYTIRLKRYRVGSETRRLFAIARRLAKSPEYATLRPHVEVMARSLARLRRKPAAPPAPDTPKGPEPPKQ